MNTCIIFEKHAVLGTALCVLTRPEVSSGPELNMQASSARDDPRSTLQAAQHKHTQTRECSRHRDSKDDELVRSQTVGGGLMGRETVGWVAKETYAVAQ